MISFVSRVCVIALVTGSAAARLQGVVDSKRSLQNDKVVPITTVNELLEAIEPVTAEVEAPIVATEETKVAPEENVDESASELGTSL